MTGRPATALGLALQDALFAGAALVGSPLLLARLALQERWRRGLAERLALRLPPALEGGPRLWIHAASAGEMGAAAELAARWRERRPGAALWLSSATLAGLQVAARRLPDAPRFLLPLDFGPAVRRVFDRVRPDGLVLVELELWPRLIAEAVRRGVRVAVANGRVSERTARRLSRTALARHVGLFAVSAFAVQGPEHAERLMRLGVEPAAVRVTGNLKADAAPPPTELRVELRLRLGADAERRVVVVGSSHPGEEALVARALGRSGVDAVLVVAPRHRERLALAERNLQDAGLEPVRWSRLPDLRRTGVGDARRVVVVDTMGELAGLYRAADVAVVGGSFVEGVGGHNVFEPVVSGAPVLIGPWHSNVRADVDFLERAGVLRVVRDEGELAAALTERIGRDRPQASAELQGALAGVRGACGRTIDALEERWWSRDRDRAETSSRLHSVDNEGIVHG